MQIWCLGSVAFGLLVGLNTSGPVADRNLLEHT